jgi:hypothetical protein
MTFCGDQKKVALCCISYPPAINCGSGYFYPQNGGSYGKISELNAGENPAMVEFQSISSLLQKVSHHFEQRQPSTGDSGDRCSMKSHQGLMPLNQKPLLSPDINRL